MMEKKEMDKILCTVDDAGAHIDVNVEFNGTEAHLLLAFSSIVNELSENGISRFTLLSAFMASELLLEKPDKDGGAE